MHPPTRQQTQSSDHSLALHRHCQRSHPCGSVPKSPEYLSLPRPTHTQKRTPLLATEQSTACEPPPFPPPPPMRLFRCTYMTAHGLYSTSPGGDRHRHRHQLQASLFLTPDEPGSDERSTPVHARGGVSQCCAATVGQQQLTTCTICTLEWLQAPACPARSGLEPLSPGHHRTYNSSQPAHWSGSKPSACNPHTQVPRPAGPACEMHRSLMS